jgi:hypothetical protein
MKRAYLVALGVLFSFAVGVAAQSRNALYVINIPFSFYVGEHQLPAGKYYVESKRPFDSSPLTLEFLRTDNNTEIALPSISNLESNGKGAEPKLVFHEYGNLHFLFQFWGSYGQGKQLVLSPLEREMASKQIPQPVSIAAQQ